MNKRQKSCHADLLNFGAGGPEYSPGLVSKDHFYHDVRIMAVRPPKNAPNRGCIDQEKDLISTRLTLSSPSGHHTFRPTAFIQEKCNADL